MQNQLISHSCWSHAGRYELILQAKISSVAIGQVGQRNILLHAKIDVLGVIVRRSSWFCCKYVRDCTSARWPNVWPLQHLGKLGRHHWDLLGGLHCGAHRIIWTCIQIDGCNVCAGHDCVDQILHKRTSICIARVDVLVVQSAVLRDLKCKTPHMSCCFRGIWSIVPCQAFQAT